MHFKHVAGAFGVVASTFMAAGCTPLPPAELVPESSRETIYLESPATALAVGADAIWVVGGERSKVFRIDPKRYIVSRSFSIHGNSVAVGGDAVWVASSQVRTLNAQPGVVYRIDPQTNQIVATVEVGTGAAAGGPGGIAVGEDAVWVANYRDDTVSRIDTLTNRVVATIAVGDHPSGIAVGEGVGVGCKPLRYRLPNRSADQRRRCNNHSWLVDPRCGGRGKADLGRPSGSLGLVVGPEGDGVADRPEDQSPYR